MYDVALSFAGEDRDLASRIADLCQAVGLTVFYDDYEKSCLWGKDLASYLDTTYRKEALFCVVLVSEAYARKMWTRHEIRSVFARAMQDSDVEYLLPVRLDDTDLPGLPPTVGYLDSRVTPPDEIVQLLGEKLGVSADNTFRLNENLEVLRRMNIPCSVFVIDRRYTDIELEPGLPAELRFAVSFGRNVSADFGRVLMPAPVKGDFMLGLHEVVTGERGANSLRMVDMWFSGRAYESDLSLLAATQAATSYLEEMSDRDYSFYASERSIYDEDAYDESRVHRSRPLRLSDMTWIQ